MAARRFLTDVNLVKTTLAVLDSAGDICINLVPAAVGSAPAEFHVWYEGEAQYMFSLDTSGTGGGSMEVYGSGTTAFSVQTATASKIVTIGDQHRFQLGTFGSDPGTLADGNMWYRTDTDRFRVRANGVTQSLAFLTDIGGATVPFTLTGDNTAALLVEKAAGTDVFRIDTTNRDIYFGTGTGFVIDTATPSLTIPGWIWLDDAAATLSVQTDDAFAFTVVDKSAPATLFQIDASAKRVVLDEAMDFKIYSDAETTLRFEVDGATGNTFIDGVVTVDTTNGDFKIGEGGFAGLQIYSSAFPAVASVLMEAGSGTGVGYLALKNPDSTVDQIMMQANDNTGGYLQILTDAGGTIFIVDGTATSAAKIFFGEAVRLDSQTSDPASPSDGDLFYRSDTDRMRLRANGAWVSIATTADIPAAFTAEDARDTIGTALVAGNNIDITVNDAGDTITIDVESLTSADITDFATAVDERARDAVGTALTAGVNISAITPNDGSDTITITANPTSASDPGSPVEGQHYTNTTTHRRRYYDGDEWINQPKITYGTTGTEPSGPSTGDVFVVIP